MTGALYLGTSGFSYPTWKPGFYPSGTPQRDFLRSYAERFNSVEQHPNRLGAFTDRVHALGGKLGPVRIVVQQARDDAFLTRLLDSLDPALRWAFDFRHESWAGAETGSAAVVDALEGDAPFRYLRLREPPYDEADLRGWAARLRPLLADGIEVYAYFKHEDEPTAPGYALRLLELLAANNAD